LVEDNYFILHDILKSIKSESLLSFPILYFEHTCDVLQNLKECTLLLERTSTPNVHFACQIANFVLSEVCAINADDLHFIQQLKIITMILQLKRENLVHQLHC